LQRLCSSQERVAGEALLVVRTTVRTIFVDGDAEETPFCAFCLVLEAHACEIDLALRRRHIGVPRTRLQRRWRHSRSRSVRQCRMSAVVEGSDVVVDVRLRQRSSERVGVAVTVERAARLVVAKNVL
jgi:hypothetical protein